MSANYFTTTAGTVLEIKKPSEPFSLGGKVLPSCPQCRGSLRDISRYGRIIRRALLDESTKKSLSWANSEYVPLAQKLAIEQESLANLETQLDVEALRTGLHLGGSRDQQLRFISNAAHGCSRYYKISKARTSYFNKVRKEEVPFVRVWELVESTGRRHGIDEQPSTLWQMLYCFDAILLYCQTSSHKFMRAPAASN